MPINIGNVSTAGAAPSLVQVPDRYDQRQMVKFGNNTIPNVGGVLSFLDLNDRTNWLLEDFTTKRDHHLLQQVQQSWRAKASWISEDYAYLKFILSERFDESGGGNFYQQIGVLMTSGEQFLTFDSINGILVKCKSVGDGKRVTTATPYLYKTDLEFWAREPFLKALTQTANNGATVAGSSGAGTTTGVTIAYTGNFFAEPTYILNIPNTNTATITSLQIQNQTGSETGTWTFSPVLTASVAHTVTVDSGAGTCKDENGKEYDVSGAFPMMYGLPSGASQNNVYNVTIVSSGATTGLTWDCRFFTRWQA